MKPAAPASSLALNLRIHAKNYTMLAALLLASWAFSLLSGRFMPGLFAHAGANGGLLLAMFELTLILILGFLAYEIAKPTIIPSFVLAIFIGMLLKSSFQVIVDNALLLNILATLGGIFILFGGGLDTPFARFRSLIGPILSVAFVGLLVTSVLFSWFLSGISTSMGIAIPVGAVVILGAALASTDPAAIIPSLKVLLFRNPRSKYIAVSESAVTDVTGPVLTMVFLGIFAAGHSAPGSISEAYAHLFSFEVGIETLLELGIGCIVGVGGFLILHFWSHSKAKAATGGEADSALFLAVPLLCFTAAMLAGGSGFLAVFISSLLFHLEEHFQHVEHYFNHTIEGFMKPLIFMLLGAVVDFQELLSIAPLGIAMGLLFMFVVRPIAIFLAVGPFVFTRQRMTVKELLFLSFVRETGVIPAVLLLGLKVSGIEGAETVVSIGLWVILLTLVVQPPLTPWVARTLGIAEVMPPFPATAHKGPVAVLCSRGDSFVTRLDTVVEWCRKHAVKSILLLHCPESKYSEHYIGQVQTKAEAQFIDINRQLEESGDKPMDFEFIGRQGLLQNNIEQLLSENNDVSIVFVGAKMLDYRLEDVKRLQAPFVFIH